MVPVTRERARRLATIAAVVALHVIVCWILLATTRPLNIRTAAESLQLIYLPFIAPQKTPAPVPAPALPSQPEQPPAASPPNRRRPASQPVQAAPEAAAAPEEENNAIHPPIDWANELNRAATASASGESAPKPREFGPHVAPTPTPKPPEFGWSRSRTHRLEKDPGRVSLHVGDHCVIALSPLPSVSCNPGKKQANEDLFKHMHDAPQLGDWKDPAPAP
ncbi:MAG: hypothetical protein M3N97_01925 [Pseudomonadota bacterium]|nr:hypothetical protein [Pseudomonadota bacterium]